MNLPSQSSIMLKLFGFSNHPRGCVFHLIRKCSTKIRSEAASGTDDEKRKYKSFPVKTRTYFKEHGLFDLVKDVPNEYRKTSNDHRYCTVVDPTLASKINIY